MNDCPVYTPDAQELVIYEALWRAANPGGSPELSGRVVVPFFLQSKVDKGILKQIWTFSCGQTLNMNKTQFFTAIRFIVMVQNGELPINKGSNNIFVVICVKYRNKHLLLPFHMAQ